MGININVPNQINQNTPLRTVRSGATAEPDYSVKYTPQDLTEAQQAQARQNIGAGTSDFSGSYNDLVDKPSVKPDLDLSTLSQTDMADFYTNYSTYKSTYDLNWAGLPIMSINTWTHPQAGQVLVLQTGIYGQSALMTGGDDVVAFIVKLVLADGTVQDFSDSMTFKTVCHTGSYNDLINKPSESLELTMTDEDGNVITGTFVLTSKTITPAS